MIFLSKYYRWILAGLALVGLFVLWMVVSTNKGMRQKIETLMLQLVITNKVADLREKAAVLQTQSQDDVKNAEAVQAQTAEIKKQIDKNKASLQQSLSDRGLDAQTIADRLSNIG